MIQLEGGYIEKLPFNELSLKKELLYFEDSPTLLHSTDDKGFDWLSYWVDFSEDKSRWLYSRVTKQEIFYYLIGNKSLRELIRDIETDFVFFVDIKSDNDVDSIKLVDSSLIPNKYLASEDSYYTEELEGEYEEYLRETSYLHLLQDDAFIINVKPSDIKHQTTVPAKEAANVLFNMASSVEGFIKSKATRVLKPDYADLSKIAQRVNAWKNLFTPRIANLVQSSFEVWLSIDMVGFNPIDKYEKELIEGLIAEYKHDVLEVDFTNDSGAFKIASKYDASERRLIYEPIFKILENSAIEVSATDLRKSFINDYKKKPLKSSFKEIMFPKPKSADLREELKKIKLVEVVMAMREGEDVSKINKKSLLDNLLFTHDIEETAHKLALKFNYADREFTLKEPLEYKVRIQNNSLQLTNEDLGLVAEGKEIDKVIEILKRQFYQLVTEYELSNDDTNDKYKELKKYL